MPQENKRPRHNRLMVKTATFGFALKIISKRVITIDARTYSKGKTKGDEVRLALGELTFAQLDRLILQLERQLQGVRIIWRSRIATRSKTIVIKISGWPENNDFQLHVCGFIGQPEIVGGKLSTVQLARLIANLKRERAFAATETRKSMN